MIHNDIEAENWLETLAGSQSFSDTRPSLVFTLCNKLSKTLWNNLRRSLCS
jgi:hypothetical protein